MNFAPKTPFFQEFHEVFVEESLGLLVRPLNGLAVVEGLKKESTVTPGSILVAVNGVDVSSSGFERAINLVKKARPVRLGFRRLHAVRDPRHGHRRMWQGYLFERFSAGKSWTGKFYVLREDGELRAYAGKECADHVSQHFVAVGGSIRFQEREVAEAARSCGDLGDDGRGALGPRAFAVPILEGDDMKWAFFRGDTLDSSVDWVSALTTLAVAAKLGKNVTSGAVGANFCKTTVVRQGYLWMKLASDKWATRLEPWRRRWFAVVGETNTLLWYKHPPDDASEVANGSCVLDGASISVKHARNFDFTVVGGTVALKLRALDADDGGAWVRALRDATDEDETRLERLKALARDPASLLRSPETAFSLLVPVDGYGGIDRDEWRKVTGLYFPVLGDVYAADVVFEALRAAQSEHLQEISSSEDISTQDDVEDAITAKLGKDFAAKYASARTAAQRFSADAGARVSELLSEPSTKRAQIETSRRRAEPITADDHRLNYDAFRRYCDALRSIVLRPDPAWADLRLRLGEDVLETLVLKEDEVSCDDYLADPLNKSVAYLTDRRLLVHIGSRVVVVPLNTVKAVTELTHDSSSSQASWGLRFDDCDVFTVPLDGKRVEVAAATPQNNKPSSSSERAFWDALVSRRDDDVDEEDDCVGASNDEPAAVAAAERHAGDADLSDIEDQLVLGTPPQSSRKSAKRTFFKAKRGTRYALRFHKLGRANLKARERARHWLEACRELVAAARVVDDATPSTKDASRLENWLTAFVEVRADARRFASQRPYFEATRRRVSLWAAINLVRREALYRGCGKAPRALLACTANRALLDAFLDGEATCTMPDGSWLRSVAVLVSRFNEFEARSRAEVETFSPLKFKDEWTVFWAHVDPIWDGCFDEIAALRRWDRPRVSFAVFAVLLAIALFDKLCYLPSLGFAAYAVAVLVTGGRVSRNRDTRRARLLQDDDAGSAGGAGGPGGPNSHQLGKKLLGALAQTGKSVAAEAHNVVVGGAQRRRAPSMDDTAARTTPQRPQQRPADAPATSVPASTTAQAGGGMFRQLRELRAGLGKAQSSLHDYNTTLIKCRALHRWTDPRRTRFFVGGLAMLAVIFACLPLNFLFGMAVCYVFSDPLFTRRGVSRALTDEYFDGLPVASRTHGNVHFAALVRQDRARFATIFPGLPRRSASVWDRLKLLRPTPPPTAPAEATPIMDDDDDEPLPEHDDDEDDEMDGVAEESPETTLTRRHRHHT